MDRLKEDVLAKFVSKSLSAIVSAHISRHCLPAPASPKRSAQQQKELINKWNEMGTDEPGISPPDPYQITELGIQIKKKNVHMIGALS